VSKTANDMMKVDVNLIRQLADMLDETGLSEIEVEDGDRKIRVARMVNAVPPAVIAPRRPLPLFPLFLRIMPERLNRRWLEHAILRLILMRRLLSALGRLLLQATRF
jgi:hypothetical protein